MGQFIGNCDRLREAWPNCTLLVLHHTGKDPSKGARGSSALNGAVDCAMVLSKEAKALVLECDKMKDAEPFNPRAFVLTPKHESLVVVPTPKVPKASTLPKSAAKALDVLKDLVDQHGPLVSLSKWRRRCYLAGLSKTGSKPEAKSKAFKRAKGELEKHGLIKVEADNVQLVPSQ
jgi:hypothetical protein